VEDKNFRNEPHVMTYCHITPKNYMTYDIKFSHIVAVLVQNHHCHHTIALVCQLLQFVI